MEKRSLGSRVATWFGLSALVFGSFCGANMASGVYASQYIVTKGGGWAFVWLAMFCVAMAFFCAVSLNFIRAYKPDNFNSYYLALWGQHKPGANPVAKGAVSVFFDIYTIFNGIITTSATIALFGTLLNTLFDIPLFVASLIGTVLFGVIVMLGPGFLRKFNSVITVVLLVSLIIIVLSVISIRGDVLAERIGNFQIGGDWGDATVSEHFFMFLTYCMTASGWGPTLSNHSGQVKTQTDAIASGILCGVLGVTLFALTGAIVLPFMPEALTASAPILQICQEHFGTALVAVYWITAMFAVISTAPNHPFNVANRFCGLWKSTKVSENVKRFVIAVIFLVICQVVSGVGLIAIVRKGYTTLGKVATFAIALPLVVSIFRVHRKDKAAKAAVEASRTQD